MVFPTDARRCGGATASTLVSLFSQTGSTRNDTVPRPSSPLHTRAIPRCKTCKMTRLRPFGIGGPPFTEKEFDTATGNPILSPEEDSGVNEVCDLPIRRP